MQRNYPSVAKACTFGSSRGWRAGWAETNRKRTEVRETPGPLWVSRSKRAGDWSACLVSGGICRRFGPSGAPQLVSRGDGEVCMNGTRGRSERRKWARLPLAIPVFVRSRDGKGKEFLEFATALNVSAGGMLVAIRRVLPPIAQIRLEIPSAPVAALALLPRASRTLRAKALRTTPAEGYYLLGLKFARPLLLSGAPKARRRKIASAV
jgi:hypothetical protein